MSDLEKLYLGCRYSKYLPKYLEKCEIIEDKSEGGYQGLLDVTFYDKYNKIYYHISYNYGSCEICDEWENLSAEEVSSQIEGLVLKMNEEEYKAWKTRKEATCPT